MSLTEDQPLLLLNLKCSKCRAIKAWFEEQRLAANERHYLEDPLSVEELHELQALLGLPVREWVRNTESAYAEAGLSADSSDEELFAAMATHPILMQRPIIVHGGQAAIGRPIDKIIELV